MHRFTHRFVAAGAATLSALPLILVSPVADVATAATPSTVSCTAPSGPAASTAVVGGFHGVTPERLVDTRQAQPVTPGCWLRVPVPASVPADAESLALTVTSDRALAPGFLTVHGCGSSLPELSNVNVRPEGPTANLVMVAIDATRQTCIFSDRGTDLIVDLVGWFGPGGSPFHESAPRRAVDTRQPSLRPPGVTGAPGVGQFVEIPRDMLGVPDEADAVMVNLTVTQATGYGYLTAFPCGDDPPNTSNVNYNVGVDRANASIMALGAQGSLCVVLFESSAHVIVDVNGWLGGATGIQFGAGPRRIADSRNGLGGWTGTFAPGETRVLDPTGLLPAGSRVAVLGVTSTASVGAGFITVQPCGGQAEVSNLNFVGGVDITNLAAVPLADNGTICVTTSERTHIVVDAFAGFGADGLARELSVSGATTFPEFAPAQHDYIAYCQSTTANQFAVHVRGMPRTTATVAFVGGTQVVDTTLTIPANDAIVVRITPTGGGAIEEYWIRCVPPDFPTITTTETGDAPPGWYVLASNNNEPTDGSFGMIMDSAGVPVWYKRGTTGRIPRDLKRLADGSLAWFQTFGPGFGNDPANGYENFPLAGTPVDLIQTVNGKVTNHHDLVQLPNGNFLLTSMRTVAALTPEAEPCRRQTAAANFPAVTSDFVLRAFVQEVDPAGNLVREWDSTGDIALTETTVPICFQVPAGTGDDYLSSIHPNAIDLDLNGPGTADDQLLVSGRHNDAVYGINFDAGTVDWKLGGTDTPAVARHHRRSAGWPGSSARHPHPSQRPHHDVRQSHQLHERCSGALTGHGCGAVRRVRHRRDGWNGHARARDPQSERVLLRCDRQRPGPARWRRRHLLGCTARHDLLRVRRRRRGGVRGAHAGPQLELSHREGATRIVRHRRIAANGGPVTAGSIDELPALPAALDALRAHVLAHCVKRGDFTLKSGATSSWFLDTKQTACRPEGIVLVADALLDIIPADATAIGGLTLGADPMAYGVAAIAATRGRPLRSFSVRKEAKDHGVTGRIAGALEPGDRVVVTEDTTTRGTSLLEAVDVVRAFGADVVLVTVIVDRGGTCAAMCADAGVLYKPLLTAPDLGFDYGT